MRPIFISYRREDAEGEAGRLFDDLVEHFGEASVFIDVDAIEAGRDFRKVIDESVSGCGVLLAVIGRNWVTVKDETGKRRLEDPSDFVRLETASALKRDIAVIPVLVHGAKMPPAEALPDDLKELAYRNGVELSHARWRSDLELLIKALHRLVGTTDNCDPSDAPVLGTPQPVVVHPVAKKPHGMMIALVLLALAALGAGGYWFWATRVAVPDLTGKTLPDATTTLQVAGLALGTQTNQREPDKSPGTIVSQSPAAGARTKSGGAVNVVIAENGRMVEVPRLTGQTMDVARVVLHDLHLAVGKVTHEARPDAAQNTILEETPKPGTKVNRGSAIDLVVSGERGAAASPPQ